MSSSVQKDARNSATTSWMTEKPPRMHFNKEDLLAILRANEVKRAEVELIRYLGNRIVGFTNAGKRFMLS